MEAIDILLFKGIDRAAEELGICGYNKLHTSEAEVSSIFFQDTSNENAKLEFSSFSFTTITTDGQEIPLCENGKDIPVSRGNYEEWVRRTLEYKLHEFDVQVEAIRRGLATIVPQRLLMLFTWEELELFVCGEPKTDLRLLRDKTIYSDCSENDPHVQDFWSILEEFTEEQRSGYIRFVWGRSRLPMSEENWEQPHKIAAFYPPTPLPGKQPTRLDDCLPFAHTCYFTLDLPRYSSKEILRKKLKFAIENCPEIDGDQTTTGRRSAAMGFDLRNDDENRFEMSADVDGNQ